jgi:hypothetical protein
MILLLAIANTLLVGVIVWNWTTSRNNWRAERICNIVTGITGSVNIVFVIQAAKGPGFLGFYRPTDWRHILCDIGFFCGYLVCALMIYSGLVPSPRQRQRQMQAERAATQK